MRWRVRRDRMRSSVVRSISSVEEGEAAWWRYGAGGGEEGGDDGGVEAGVAVEVREGALKER